jgi:hypothetical protein
LSAPVFGSDPESMHARLFDSQQNNRKISRD